MEVLSADALINIVMVAHLLFLILLTREAQEAGHANELLIAFVVKEVRTHFNQEDQDQQQPDNNVD